MTEQTTQQDAALQQAEDAKVQAWTEAAQAQESEAAMQANILHLQRRAVALNVEVRNRDERIAHLESEVAALRSQIDTYAAAAPDAEEAGTEPDAH